jgi:uncharacterized repeat protein (TIGR03803 family)
VRKSASRCCYLGVGVLLASSSVHAATLTTLVSFDNTNGANPGCELILDNAGNLYGTTQLGGAGQFGTVFRMDVGTNALTTLIEFTGTNGSLPAAGLVADANGVLYGTTSTGEGTFGAKYFGSVFKIEGSGYVVRFVPEPVSVAVVAMGSHQAEVVL